MLCILYARGTQSTAQETLLPPSCSQRAASSRQPLASDARSSGGASAGTFPAELSFAPCNVPRLIVISKPRG